MKKLEMFDADGDVVVAGDWIEFSYGIPPIGVMAEVVQRGGKLVALTPDHEPTVCSLDYLRKSVGEWYKCK
jgi:hypothetical protein